ncbi:uncharacterized protein LOC106050860 isoform X3 [Biomphalaria glabrata]|uniref:Uncharacterized protein LOC106050860 isoform X3 n=1 Tax=Biomphalaria glabrata TaxID=6526 RepID=A0A9W2YRS6_BIOGL|nr:uncharacterized protein LOC106050860 isoform X3 [Biomphalaria glabrata]
MIRQYRSMYNTQARSCRENYIKLDLLPSHSRRNYRQSLRITLGVLKTYTRMLSGLKLCYCLLIGLHLCFLSAASPHLCQENRYLDNITGAVGSSGNITMCIASRCPTDQCFTVRIYKQTSDMPAPGHSSDVQDVPTFKFNHTWVKNATSSRHHFLFLEIYKITQADYGVWNVVISENRQRNLTFSILVLNPDTASSMTFKFRSTKASNELSIDLMCSVGQYPKDVAIRRLGDSKFLQRKTFNPKNVQKTLTLKVEISPALCLDMTTYECISQSHQHQESLVHLEVPIEKCPVRLCKGQPQRFTRHSHLGGTAHITLCVVAYPNISNTILLDSIEYDIANTSWIDVFKNGSVVYTYVRITKHQLGHDDFRNYSVEIRSLLNDSVKVNFQLLKQTPAVTCSNASTFCVLKEPGNLMIIYAQKDLTIRSGQSVRHLFEPAQEEAIVNVLMNRSLPTETLQVELWKAKSHESTIQGDNWVYLGNSSGLKFCCDQGMLCSWSHSDHKVNLEKQNAPSACYRLETNAAAPKETFVSLYTLTMSKKQYLVSTSVTSRTTISDSTQIDDITVIGVVSGIIAILIICCIIAAIMILKSRKGEKDTERENYLFVTEPVYDRPVYGRPVDNT